MRSNKINKMSLVKVQKKDNKINKISLNKKIINFTSSSNEYRSTSRLFKTVNYFPKLNYSFQKNKSLNKKPKEISFFSNDEFYY